MRQKPDIAKRNAVSILTFALIFVAVFFFSLRAEAVQAKYLYQLSTFTGTVPYDYAVVSADDRNKEINVLSGNSVDVFNDRGMAIYSFDDEDPAFGRMYAFTFDEEGTLFGIFRRGQTFAGLVRCNYRGEPVQKIELKSIPEEIPIYPSGVVFHNGFFYLWSSLNMNVIVTDKEGNFSDYYDLSDISVGDEERDREDFEIASLFVDKEGNIVTVSPATAKVYVISPEKQLRRFGKRGSVAGKFGIPIDVTRDNAGNYYVLDILRHVVVVFSDKFKFLSEFGHRGLDRSGFIAPRSLTVSSDSKLYVTQSRNRGVSVFQLTYD